MKQYIYRFALPLIGITMLSAGQAQAQQSHHSHHQCAVHAASQFEKSAIHMHRLLYHSLGRVYLTKSARKLIRSANRYRRALEGHDPYRYRQRQFEELIARFRVFRSEYRHAYLPDSRRTHRAIRWLNESFLNLRHEIRHARRRHHYPHRNHGSYRGDHRRSPGSVVAVLDDSP